MTDSDKIDSLLEHIRNVQNNCVLLGRRLMKHGEVEFGRMLIANGFIHDASKFYGMEWDHLWRDNEDKDSLANSVRQHNRTNPHHPEYWGSIHNMPRIYIAEMVCDWKARSNEFGSSLLDWINGDASKRYNFSQRDEVYEEIMYFFGILCDQPFKPLKPESE